MDGGRQAVDGGRWTMDGGRQAVDGGRWTVDGGRWTVDDGRWTAEDGRWTADDIRRTAEGEQTGNLARSQLTAAAVSRDRMLRWSPRLGGGLAPRAGGTFDVWREVCRRVH